MIRVHDQVGINTDRRCGEYRQQEPLFVHRDGRGCESGGAAGRFLLYGCLIAIGGHTAELVRGSSAARAGLIRPRAPTSRWQSELHADGAATDAQREMVARFAIALEHYRAMRFSELAVGGTCERYEPAPSPSSIMVRACEVRIGAAGIAWNGVFVLIK